MEVILVKSTKELNDEDKYQMVLEAAGFDVSLVPVLSFSFIDDQNILGGIDQSNVRAVAFTSPRAVQASRPLLTQWPELLSVQAFCVGKATEVEAAALGFDTTGAESGTAEELASVIADWFDSNEVEGGSVFFPKGNLAREKLPDGLKERGISVVELILYTTAPHPRIKENLEHIVENREMECRTDPLCLVFFSPSGVNFSYSSLKELDLLRTAQIVAIGKTTEESLKAHELIVSGTSVSPTPEALLDLLVTMRSNSS